MKLRSLTVDAHFELTGSLLLMGLEEFKYQFYNPKQEFDLRDLGFKALNLKKLGLPSRLFKGVA